MEGTEMFLRLGVAFGPIVESNETTVWIEAFEPFDMDGKRIAILKSELIPFETKMVADWERAVAG
jgi:hypothetical protein